MKKRKVISYETVNREYEQEVEAETKEEAIQKAHEGDRGEGEDCGGQQDSIEAVEIE